MSRHRRDLRETAKEFDEVGQDEGDVFVTCLPDDHMMIPSGSTLTLLQVVLCAIKADGDPAKLELARKVARSWLGALT